MKAASASQLLISRLTGQWDLGRFHLYDNRVNQDLDVQLRSATGSPIH
jgi:hypothetical protein